MPTSRDLDDRGLMTPPHRDASPVRVVLYGVGTVGQDIARLLVDAGADLVAVIGRRANVGRDLGQVLGRDPLGVVVRDDAEDVLRTTTADLVVHAVGEGVDEAAIRIETCLAAGLPVLSANEGLFYPWRRATEIARRLDAAALAHGLPVLAGGAQDTSWLAPALALSGTATGVTALAGLTTGDVAALPGVAEAYGFGGMSLGEIDPAELAFHDETSSVACDALADALGLTIVSRRQEVLPRFADAEVRSEALAEPIAAGTLRGVAFVSIAETAEGVTLSNGMEARALADGEVEATMWSVTGTPSAQLVLPQVPVLGVAASLVNRIPDLLAAGPGLHTVVDLPAPRFHHRLRSLADWRVR